jgi:hypothetical protein
MFNGCPHERIQHLNLFAESSAGPAAQQVDPQTDALQPRQRSILVLAHQMSSTSAVLID